ncbi:hypothetical protein BJ742DRAFT_817172 [Cladochytrium replicatum]|nr:hypothetical protein BJ742DRAFT_817172 [Cladochytrium replicatum]
MSVPLVHSTTSPALSASAPLLAKLVAENARLNSQLTSLKREVLEKDASLEDLRSREMASLDEIDRLGAELRSRASSEDPLSESIPLSQHTSLVSLWNSAAQAVAHSGSSTPSSTEWLSLQLSQAHTHVLELQALKDAEAESVRIRMEELRVSHGASLKGVMEDVSAWAEAQEGVREELYRRIAVLEQELGEQRRIAIDGGKSLKAITNGHGENAVTSSSRDLEMEQIQMVQTIKKLADQREDLRRVVQHLMRTNLRQRNSLKEKSALIKSLASQGSQSQSRRPSAAANHENERITSELQEKLESSEAKIEQMAVNFQKAMDSAQLEMAALTVELEKVAAESKRAAGEKEVIATVREQELREAGKQIEALKLANAVAEDMKNRAMLESAELNDRIRILTVERLTAEEIQRRAETALASLSELHSTQSNRLNEADTRIAELHDQLQKSATDNELNSVELHSVRSLLENERKICSQLTTQIQQLTRKIDQLTSHYEKSCAERDTLASADDLIKMTAEIERHHLQQLRELAPNASTIPDALESIRKQQRALSDNHAILAKLTKELGEKDRLIAAERQSFEATRATMKEIQEGVRIGQDGLLQELQASRASLLTMQVDHDHVLGLINEILAPAVFAEVGPGADELRSRWQEVISQNSATFKELESMRGQLEYTEQRWLRMMDDKAAASNEAADLRMQLEKAHQLLQDHIRTSEGEKSSRDLRESVAVGALNVFLPNILVNGLDDLVPELQKAWKTMVDDRNEAQRIARTCAENLEREKVNVVVATERLQVERARAEAAEGALVGPELRDASVQVEVVSRDVGIAVVPDTNDRDTSTSILATTDSSQQTGDLAVDLVASARDAEIFQPVSNESVDLDLAIMQFAARLSETDAPRMARTQSASSGLRIDGHATTTTTTTKTYILEPVQDNSSSRSEEDVDLLLASLAQMVAQRENGNAAIGADRGDRLSELQALLKRVEEAPPPPMTAAEPWGLYGDPNGQGYQYAMPPGSDIVNQGYVGDWLHSQRASQSLYYEDEISPRAEPQLHDDPDERARYAALFESQGYNQSGEFEGDFLDIEAVRNATISSFAGTAETLRNVYGVTAGDINEGGGDESAVMARELDRLRQLTTQSLVQTSMLLSSRR